MRKMGGKRSFEHGMVSIYMRRKLSLGNWMRPSKNARMSPRLFKNKIFRVWTRTTIPKQPNGKLMPDTFKYSIVDSILEVVAG